MSTPFETREEAWKRRTSLRRKVDFTMMYVAHDALLRDLDRLTAAGGLLSPQARGTWALFDRMLRLHHGAEDVALWPALRAAVTDTAEVALLDAMEAEHAAIDPLLDSVTAELARNRAAASRIRDLRESLHEHLVHEEHEALPLLERTLGEQGWKAFPEEIARRQRPTDLPMMLPWLLDGVSESIAGDLASMLPETVRVALADEWTPAYRRAEVLHTGTSR